MTQAVTIPTIGAAAAWRDAARGFLSTDTPPEAITWGTEDTPQGLFDTPAPLPAGGQLTVPRRFVQLANSVVWHRDADRFARLYALLWRLHRSPNLLHDRSDPALAHLLRMEKNVHRCQHKMKAFVRFREVGDPTAPRRAFAAWFEPTHHTVEPTADFFRARFADMNWRIHTPSVCAIFDGSKLTFEEGHAAPDLPPDASEALWITYFRNIFNPARLKVSAMQSEMPKKYWKNMPEAAEIPDLIANAPARARAMAAAGPSLPSPTTDKLRQQAARHRSAWSGTPDTLLRDLHGCTRCPLHASATQAVPGEGPLDAALMIVGEQPGDQEDLQGRPFIGPAGQVLDAAIGSAGLDRAQLYLTNAVKHFKYTAQARKRLHQRPNAGEVQHCKWWLEAEIALIRPRLIVAMGATAALALTGNGSGIMARRGRLETGPEGTEVLITLHPAFVLRAPDPVMRQQAAFDLQADLAQARKIAFSPVAGTV